METKTFYLKSIKLKANTSLKIFSKLSNSLFKGKT